MCKDCGRCTDGCELFFFFVKQRDLFLQQITGFQICGSRLSARKKQHIIRLKIQVFHQDIRFHSDMVGANHFLPAHDRYQIHLYAGTPAQINHSQCLHLFKSIRQKSCYLMHKLPPAFFFLPISFY